MFRQSLVYTICRVQIDTKTKMQTFFFEKNLKSLCAGGTLKIFKGWGPDFAVIGKLQHVHGQVWCQTIQKIWFTIFIQYIMAH